MPKSAPENDDPANGPASDSGADDLITNEMRLSFFKESSELLDSTEQSFLHLEKFPADGEVIAQAFRNIHSFKGNCGFFGFTGLERLSHRLESALEGVRASGGALPLPIVETALQCIDVFRAAVSGLSTGMNPDIHDLSVWLDRLDGLEFPAAPEAAVHEPALEKRPLGQILIDEGLASPSAVAHALELQSGAAERPLSAVSGKPTHKDSQRDIRVDLSKLDLLMDLVGELVISTGMVFNHPIIRGSDSPDLERTSHQLKGVVSDLQGVALGIRMVPIEGTFRKMTRLVHDLSAKVGKKAALEFLGEDTEVDKTVVDLIADPLVHMIRNSLDHGLEDGAERAAAGKPPTGVVTLEAGQEGGEILIVIRDDGRGLDREKILRKAMERGLVQEGGPSLSDSEVFQFIFQPGFSTAQTVTATSGRGVGMDVVKSNMDKLGGRISIASEQGQGTAITLRIPLTLSILDGMMVQTGDSLFILPLTAIRESISPRKQDIFSLAGGQEMLKLRGRSLPILRLADIYGIPGAHARTGDGILIHLEAGEAQYCLAVDNLLGQRQVVVKSLPGFMSRIPGTSSCSILDNGEIALILDVIRLGLAKDRPGSKGPQAETPRRARIGDLA